MNFPANCFCSPCHCQAEWPERYAVAAATVKSLQQRLEDGKRSEKEKDASLARLTSRMRQLEESMQRGCMEADEKEARRERESKMLQDVSSQSSRCLESRLALCFGKLSVYPLQSSDNQSDILCPQLFKEYDSLGNEHERLKVAQLICNHCFYDFSSHSDTCEFVSAAFCLFLRNAFVSTEQLHVNRGQTFERQRSNIRTEEVSEVISFSCLKSFSSSFFFL